MTDSAHIEHNNKVAAYYDQTILIYKYFWSDPKTLSSHAGVWERGVRTHREAHELNNRLLAERVGISAKDRVLDAGCGMGGSALWMAETYGAHVEGITVSSSQLGEAQRSAAQRKLEHLVTFSLGDYTAMDFGDASFDVVWACESVVHAVRKRDFLAEAFRVLRPGGRLVLADYFRRARPLPLDDEKWLYRTTSGSAIPDLDTPEEFFAKIQDVGFCNLDFEEHTSNIVRSLRKLYYFSLLTLPVAWVAHRLGLASDVLLKGSIANYAQYQTCRRKLVPYIILSAYKPEA